MRSVSVSARPWQPHFAWAVSIILALAGAAWLAERLLFTRKARFTRAATPSPNAYSPRRRIWFATTHREALGISTGTLPGGSRLAIEAMGEPNPGSWTNTVEEPSDARRVLQRIAAGDREAFQAFYARYGPRVMAMVRRRVVGRALAEELVQDVFVAAWLGAAGYREEMGEPERWLLGITRHKVQDHWRRMRGLAQALGSHPESARPERRMPDEDTRLTVEEALAGLPPEQRRALDLIYQGGLTFAETAHALKVPVGTVKSRVHAALLSLRVFFKRSGAS